MTTTWSAMVAARVGARDPAVVYPDGSSWTLDELLTRGASAAVWLDDQGAERGRPVPALVPAARSSFALLCAGAGSERPLAPLSARFTVPELTACVLDLGPTVILASPDARAVAEEVGARTKLPVAVVPEDFTSPGRELDMDPPGDATVVVLHTSGTTGAPKPVYQRQAPMAKRVPRSAGPMQLGPGSRFATASAFHHQAGAGMLLVAIGVGATLVPLANFSPDTWTELSPLGVTHATVVPALIEAALAADVLALPTLEWILYGSSPLHPDTARRLLEEFPNIRLVQNLGQTEGGPITTLYHEDHVQALEHAPHRLRSVGRPTEGTELRIEDADDSGIGEICSRADHYFLTDADGWLRTGDLGYQDDDGFVYLVARKQDVINRGGDKVYPAEVELVIASHPDVREAAVVGISDRRLGSVPHAWIVPADPSNPPSPNELFAYARAQLAGFKVPRDWHITDELPRNPAGKLLRHALAPDADD
ncbi:MAG: class I adenylate-forming enzyme family protein [Acidimicrobiia bacterium]